MLQLQEDATDDFEIRKFSTVGAVALDQHGTITAGTSTGGMTISALDVLATHQLSVRAPMLITALAASALPGTVSISFARL